MIKIRFIWNCSCQLLDSLLTTVKHENATFDSPRIASFLWTVASWGGGVKKYQNMVALFLISSFGSW